MTCADVIRVSSVSQCEVHVAVRPKGDGAAVMVSGGFAEGNDFATRIRIHDTGVRRRNFPFVDDVSIIIGCGGGNGISRQYSGGIRFAVISVKRAITRARGIRVAGMKSKPEES